MSVVAKAKAFAAYAHRDHVRKDMARTPYIHHLTEVANLVTMSGGSDAEIAAVRASGYAGWLQAQIAAPRGPTGTEWLDARGANAVVPLSRSYFSTAPADHMAWAQLMTSPDAPRRRMALALSSYAYVLETGQLVLSGEPQALWANDDIRAAYLGGRAKAEALAH